MATFAARRGPVAALAALVLVLVLVFLSGLALAADPDFPKLTGRVTDAAGILAPDARRRIEDKLKAHEDKTTDQVMVATVPNLQGLTVEDFANRLFRAWGLGEKAKNNGVLLLVAPKERKVRIEVGYGLEGAITDALSKVIITTAITPKFKQGDFAAGIEGGIDAILSILTGDAEEWHRRAEVRNDDVGSREVIIWIAIIVFLIVFVGLMSAGSRRRGRGGGIVFLPGSPGGWSGGYSGGGGFGGGSASDSGFSGGGGSSGGGGASGDW